MSLATTKLPKIELITCVIWLIKLTQKDQGTENLFAKIKLLYTLQKTNCMNEVIEQAQPQPEEIQPEEISSDNKIIIIKFNKEFTEAIYTIYKSTGEINEQRVSIAGK